MFGGTGSNRDVRPESLSHRRHREEKVVPSSPSWPVPHKPKRARELDPLLVRKRRRIETVAGNLVEVYLAKRVWVRDR